RSGNLYVVVRVLPDERFERDGPDLHTEVPISFPQAALGDKLPVSTLVGAQVDMTVPPGSQPGDTVLLRGHGLPRLQDKGNGNLVVHLKVVVPKTLSEEQEHHLRLFAASGGQNVEPPEEK